MKTKAQHTFEKLAYSNETQKNIKWQINSILEKNAEAPADLKIKADQVYDQALEQIDNYKANAFPLAALGIPTGLAAGGVLGGILAGLPSAIKGKHLRVLGRPEANKAHVAAGAILGGLAGSYGGYEGSEALTTAVHKAALKKELKSLYNDTVYPEHNYPGFSDWSKLK